MTIGKNAHKIYTNEIFFLNPISLNNDILKNFFIFIHPTAQFKISTLIYTAF